MKKQIKTAASCALAVILAAANCVSAYAAKETVIADDIVNAIHANDLVKDQRLRDHNELFYPSWRMPDVDVSELPSKFDLRDVDGKNYVSPVKLQNPWGTCWSFGATAASETSLAYELGHDYNAETGSDVDNMFDLSEKHLAWFSYTALPEDSETYSSQSGEGYYMMYDYETSPDGVSDKVYNIGGAMNYATMVYSAGMGPTLEAIVPYEKTTDTEYLMKMVISYEICEDGTITEDLLKLTNYFGDALSVDDIKDEWTAKGYEETDYKTAATVYNSYITGTKVIPDYTGGAVKKFTVAETSSNGDWTLDESNRFLSLYTLKDGNMLPTPALIDDEGGYVFNQTGVDAIKSELYNGRAVSIAFCADQSRPGQALSEDSFISFVDKDGNKTDDKLAEYWAHYSYDREYDPTDKNSVNKAVEANHAVCVVGYDDNFPKEYFNDPKGTIGGNGAFLVKNSWGTSVTDENGEIVSTWGNAGTGYFWLSYYDQSLTLAESFDFDTSEDHFSRNIDMYDFLASYENYSVSFDSDVYMANVFTAQNNCTARYIGLETTEADADVQFSVYLLSDDAKSPVDGICVATAEDHFNYAGYHVADIGKTCYIPKGEKYSIVIKAKADDKSTVFYKELANEGFYAKEDKEVNFYAKGVVNPGESYVGTSLTDINAWTDWSDIITRLRAMNADLNDDNFEYDNLSIRSYPQTETFSILNLNREPEDVTYKAGDELKGCVVVENNSGFDLYGIGSIEISVSIGDSVKNYSLADISNLKPGKQEIINYVYTVTEKDVAAGSLTSTVAVLFNGEEADFGALFDENLTFTVKTEGGSSSVDAAEENNPATGNELFSAAALAGAAAAIAFASRKRR